MAETILQKIGGIFSRQPQDTSILFFSDLHTGGTTSLHPNVKLVDGEHRLLDEIGGWRYVNNNHYYLNSRQVEIWGHYEKCLDYAKQQRRDKKALMISTGDAIEGDHHGTFELATHSITEQINTHIELMEYTQKRIDFQAGDKIIYLDGTKTHVGDEEQSIGARLNAHKFPGGRYSAAFIALEVNGALLWIYHKGKTAGNHPNRGQAAANMLKQLWYQCLFEDERPPDIVISGHVHDPHHAVWSTPKGNIMHYLILPSWQDKTRFARDNMPTSINKVGMQVINISASGGIDIPLPVLLKNKFAEVVKI